MCEHDKLKAIEFDEDKDSKENATYIEISSTGVSNPWAFIVDGYERYSYRMGRIYECEECGKQFVIQSMFELPKQYKNKEKK